jgi:hypothetical protein
MTCQNTVLRAHLFKSVSECIYFDGLWPTDLAPTRTRVIRIFLTTLCAIDNHRERRSAVVTIGTLHEHGLSDRQNRMKAIVHLHIWPERIRLMTFSTYTEWESSSCHLK